MIKEPISQQKVKIDLQKILNKKISKAWKGYGSALFLELGELHNELAWKKGGEPTTALAGELTLSSEGSWKLFRNKKELLDAEKASSADIIKIISDFEEEEIMSVSFEEKLSIHLSNNDILEFRKADYGFFTLVANEKSFISYEDNAPYIHHASL